MSDVRSDSAKASASPLRLQTYLASFARPGVLDKRLDRLSVGIGMVPRGALKWSLDRLGKSASP